MEKIKFQGLFQSKKTKRKVSIFTSDETDRYERSNIVKKFWNINGSKKAGIDSLRYKVEPLSGRCIDEDISYGFNNLLLTNAQYEDMSMSNDFDLAEKPLSNIFEQIKVNV